MIYSICFIIGMIVLIIVYVMLLADYKKKNKELKDKEIAMRQRLEREFEEKRNLYEENFMKKQNELNKKIEKLNQEQNIRESFENKSDREITIEMHIKLRNVFEILSGMDSKLEKVEKTSKAQIVLQNNMCNAIDNVSSTVNNMQQMDSYDIRSAVEEALDSYDSYSFKSGIESIVEDAINNALSSRL